MKVSCLQTNPQRSQEENIKFIFSQARLAKAQGADVIVFPEMFTYMGEESKRKETASPLSGGAFAQTQAHSKELDAIIVAGSHCESIGGNDGKVYNTCVTYLPTEVSPIVYRKQHLFNLLGPQGEKLYCESDSYAPGEAAKPYVLESNGDSWQCLNLICYDIRFPEIVRKQAQPIDILFVVAAFTWQTGKDHWEILLRARAIENQCYVVACNQTGEFLDGQKRNYGHSMVIDPWGNIIEKLDEEVGILIATLDKKRLQECRQKLPALHDRKIFWS